MGEALACSVSSFTDLFSTLVAFPPEVLDFVTCLVSSVGLLVEEETVRGGLSWVTGVGGSFLGRLFVLSWELVFCTELVLD